MKTVLAVLLCLLSFAASAATAATETIVLYGGGQPVGYDSNVQPFYLFATNPALVKPLTVLD